MHCRSKSRWRVVCLEKGCTNRFWERNKVLHRACVSRRKGMLAFYDRGCKYMISKDGERGGWNVSKWAKMHVMEFVLLVEQMVHWVEARCGGMGSQVDGMGVRVKINIPNRCGEKVIFLRLSWGMRNRGEDEWTDEGGWCQ